MFSLIIAIGVLKEMNKYFYVFVKANGNISGIVGEQHACYFSVFLK